MAELGILVEFSRGGTRYKPCNHVQGVYLLLIFCQNAEEFVHDETEGNCSSGQVIGKKRKLVRSFLTRLLLLPMLLLLSAANLA
uniref:Uncharacterized protein n=1 Tax=Oryza brachyantha TaxID=4533 RepID=J3LN00_ORYBR